MNKWYINSLLPLAQRADNEFDDPSDDGDDEALLIAGRRFRGRLFHGLVVL